MVHIFLTKKYIYFGINRKRSLTQQKWAIKTFCIYNKIVEFKISWFWKPLYLESPKRITFVKELSEIFGVPLSIPLRLLLRVIQIALKWWQCRKKWVADSTSKLQVHKGFRQLSKLWLNLCSLRWLSPSLSLVSNFKPNELWILYTGAANGRILFIR